ncbi:serine hydrolase domain-containing protein [Sphingomonas sp. RS2018]
MTAFGRLVAATLALTPLSVGAQSARPTTAVPAETPDQVARRYNLAGEMLVARGERILLDRGYGTVAPAGGAAHRAGERWRLASISKQVTAALLVQQFAGRLDQPVAPMLDYMLPAGFEELTLRQLLTHHSGLANPDDSPATAAGVPAFYSAVEPDMSYCLRAKSQPGGAFSYNNCDYLVAESIHAFVNGRAVDRPWPRGMAMAVRGELGVPGFVGGKAEPAFQLASYGAAGGLMGTARAVFDFDRSLMTGKLLSPTALAELWTPEGNGSYQAVGQWVFPGRLKGCAAPKRIVQRDGEIGGVQARNYILPDDDLIVIVFSNRSSDDFPLGEVWEGRGFVHDLLSAAACP